MTTSTAIAGVGGMVVGGAVAGAAVAARYEAKEHFQNLAREKDKAQFEVVCCLFDQHVAKFCDRGILESARETTLELPSLAPAYPHFKLAFDAVLSYQRHRTKRDGNHSMLNLVRLCSGTRRKENDQKTVVCEILKAWVQAKCEDVDIHIEEVEAYRNFARGFLLHESRFPQDTRFINMTCHVAQHLDFLGQCLLRQKQDCTKYIKALRKEAYNFVLHAVKLLLLGPTTFKIPDKMYSCDSLGWLRRTALNCMIHACRFDQQIAEQMRPEWDTVSGRLVQGMLCSDHGSDLCNLMEGNRIDRNIKPLRIVIHRAEGLPMFTELDFGAIDPFVQVTVRLLDAGHQKVISQERTQVLYNTTSPVWETTLEVCVVGDSVCCIDVEIFDYHVASFGMVQNPLFARIVTIDASDALDDGRAGNQRWFPLLSGGSNPKQLDKARLLLGFEVPDLGKEIQSARKRWEQPAFCPHSDGLLTDDLAMCFLRAVDETDSLIYFLDILFSDCLGIAQSLGNLGMVLCANLMRPLLDEIEMRLLSVEKVIEVDLLQEVYRGMVSQRLGKKSWFNFFGTTAVELNPHVTESTRKLKGIKSQMLEDVTQLRQLCCLHYDTANDVLLEARESMSSLLGRIASTDTAKRSRRFGCVGGTMPTLLQSGSAAPCTPGALPEPTASQPAEEVAPRARALTDSEAVRQNWGLARSRSKREGHRKRLGSLASSLSLVPATPWVGRALTEPSAAESGRGAAPGARALPGPAAAQPQGYLPATSQGSCTRLPTIRLGQPRGTQQLEEGGASSLQGKSPTSLPMTEALLEREEVLVAGRSLSSTSEDVRINPEDGEPMTRTDLHFLKHGISEAEREDLWQRMQKIEVTSSDARDTSGMDSKSDPGISTLGSTESVGTHDAGALLPAISSSSDFEVGITDLVGSPASQKRCLPCFARGRRRSSASP